jgi:hypothetical protein
MGTPTLPDKLREAVAALDRLVAIANDLTCGDWQRVAAATLAVELGLAVRRVSAEAEIAALEREIEELRHRRGPAAEAGAKGSGHGGASNVQ